MPTLAQIALAWRNRGYGAYRAQSDGSYLLYHYTLTTPQARYHYHIHMGIGWATSTTRHDGHQEHTDINGCNSLGTDDGYAAESWADYLWEQANYDAWSGGSKHTRRAARIRTRHTARTRIRHTARTRTRRTARTRRAVY